METKTMTSSTTMVKGDKGEFIETGIIEFQGKKFSNGGAWLCENVKTGKLEGILYESLKTKEVTSWDGSIRIPAVYGSVFEGNFYGFSGQNKRRYCWFQYQDKKFMGINYSVDNQDCIKVHEIKG